MGAFGLSRMMRGAVQGLGETEARRDRETEREHTELQRDRETEQYDQGQEDREWALKRRDIETDRADKEAAQLEESRQRKMMVAESLRAMAMGDLAPINELHNRNTPEGLDYIITANEDGTFTKSATFGGQTKEEKLSKEELGMQTMLFMDDAAIDQFNKAIEEAKAARALEGERGHEKTMLDREYGYKKDIEHIKGGYKKATEGVGGGKVPPYMKELQKLSKEEFSTLTADGLFAGFDEPSKATMRNNLYELARVHYLTSNDPNVASANNAASNEMRIIARKAEKQADMDVDDDLIEKADRDNRVSELVTAYTKQLIDSRTPEGGFGAQDEGQVRLTREQRQQGGVDQDRKGPPPKPGTAAHRNDYIERMIEKGLSAGKTEDQARKAAEKLYDEKVGGKKTPEKKTTETPKQEGRRTDVDEEKAVKADTGGATLGRAKPLPESAKPKETPKAGGTTARETLSRRVQKEKPTKAKSKRDETPANPRKDFKTTSQKLWKALSAPVEKERDRNARAILKKYTPDYMQQLTQKQREKADKMIKEAKLQLKKVPPSKPRVIRGQEAANELRRERMGTN